VLLARILFHEIRAFINAAKYQPYNRAGTAVIEGEATGVALNKAGAREA
jgi:hypothetical protein